MATPTYVPLWTKSNASFLEGASHPEELVDQAARLDLPALALTDRDGVYGLVRAHVRAREKGLALIAGAEVTIADDAVRSAIVLACNRRGWAQLCGLLTRGRMRCEKGSARVELDELCEVGPDVIVLGTRPAGLAELRRAHGDRVYALCTRHLGIDDREREAALREAADAASVPVVAGTEVLYHGDARRSLQDVLRCIRHGTIVQRAGRVLTANAEHDLKSPMAMQRLFADDPSALARTHEVAERCRFSLSELDYRYPAEFVPGGRSESDWLRELGHAGARCRYGAPLPAAVRTQLEHELTVVHELGYGGYFLTMREIVEFCRHHDILCQGRGSAANSVLAYVLGITAIDPVGMELLFERFLSRERAEPPDIDLDIEHRRREEVIQWVYGRYGRERAAMVANVVRYRGRSAVRDVGKALGIPETTLDRVARLLGHYSGHPSAETLAQAGLDPEAPTSRHLLRLCDEIADFPRHLSIHPGGFLLGHEPIPSLVPIEPATMQDRTVIQWDKYDVEALGLFKVDLLGLGALTHIHGCLDLLRAHESIDLEMATIPTEDPATYAMISAGDTVGVFQIESRAQMAMLPRLRPRTFYDLVIEVAIVRPGPIQGDMVHPYLQRRTGREPIDSPHPDVERVLRKTLGVPIFQEQVMKLAVLVADYSPGEADQLRRDMAAWRSSGRIEAHRERLIDRMLAHGITREFAERVFSQILGFGEYGFPESHAASFALIAYVTAWLRRHHMAVFTCALLNAQPMGFYAPATIVEDARHHGIEVRPIDARESGWDCTLEPVAGAPRFAVRMGLRWVKGLGERERERLAAAPGPHPDLESFVRATRLGRKPLHALAEAGAFAGFDLDRRQASWALRGLFAGRDDALALPEPEPSERIQFSPLLLGEEILWDYRSSSHSTRGHPLQSIRPRLDRLRMPLAEAVVRMPDGRRTAYVGLVICRQQPSTASGVTFCTLEDESGFVNVVIWRQVFERHAILARTALLLGVRGRIQAADGVVHLVADTLWAPEIELSDPGTRSRDFH